MSSIEKIRQEIERRLRDYSEDTQFEIGKRRGYKNILDFIDSLPEDHFRDSTKMISKEQEEEIPPYCTGVKGDPDLTGTSDLEEELDNYFEGLWPGIETAEQCNTDLHFTPPAIMRLARHFAEWQKAKDDRETTELMTIVALDAGQRAREEMPLPEDTVIFMKGVAEGRRLEREDREENKRKEDELPRYYGD